MAISRDQNPAEDQSPAGGETPAPTEIVSLTENGDPTPTDAPRPPSPDDIVAMMDEAAERHADSSDETVPEIEQAEIVDRPRERAPTSLWGQVSFWALWGSFFLGLGAVCYLVLMTRGASASAMFAAGAVTLLTAFFMMSAASKKSSPLLLAGAMLRRAGGAPKENAAELAGAEILSALGLAERVLDADNDAFLVTRLDGVVTYANRAYQKLARTAGVTGPAGLPPRIDRLFAQQGAESTKIFRLCRAAKSAAAAEETIYQIMGLTDGGVRRCFHVSVNPIRGAEEHVVWKLRELPVDEEKHDVLSAAYADFPEPVFAVEKSGQIAWANAALRKALGADRTGLLHIDDIVPGETGDLTRNLWQVAGDELNTLVRRAQDDPIEAKLNAFRRGGVGEGFVCVRVELHEEDDTPEDVKLSGDIAESPFGIAIIDGELNRDARIHAANKAFAAAFGTVKQNTPLSRCLPNEALTDLAEIARKKPRAGTGLGAAEAQVDIGEESRTFAIYPRPVRRKRGAYGARQTILYAIDITDRKMMEVGYGQDQRLRGIGELASKVAHDFNNYLQVVLGHCELLMLRHPAGDPAYPDLVQIRENAQRAANTTKQLLAFSRKQTLQREIISITDVLQDFSRFLTRAIGEKVKLNLLNGRGLSPVKVDRHQLETAIMNLAVNARDAMGSEGGTLTIETSAIPAEDATNLDLPGMEEGDLVLIEVRDTGPGVPGEIVEKIFEPFFTTKASGKGTGLGLSTVYGVIRQMGGVIKLDQQPGAGAVFRIYLTAHELGADEEIEGTNAPAARQPQDLTGAGRILVVEDEAPVRSFVIATLTNCGYEVTAAEDGEDALEIIEENGADFDLVLSDVMMNYLDGPAFVVEARKTHDLSSKVIFMSGYAEDAVRKDLDLVEGAGYIQKPFTVKGLAALVKQALDPDAE